MTDLDEPMACENCGRMIEGVELIDCNYCEKLFCVDCIYSIDDDEVCLKCVGSTRLGIDMKNDLRGIKP